MMKKMRFDVDPDRDLLFFALNLAAATFVIAAVAFGAYIYKFGGQGLSPNQSRWGEFGDFLGGVINPVVGIATVFLLLITVILQRKELRNSIAEMRSSNLALSIQNAAIAKQSFEQTFFSWLSSYRELVASISSLDVRQSPRAPISGREALFATWGIYFSWEKILGDIRSNVSDSHADAIEHGAVLDHRTYDLIEERILLRWEKIYDVNEHHIDSMFRTLYRLIRWVDEQSTELTSDEKWHYISIIRAQVSQIEIKYLFCNGFTERGRNFVSYINKYAFFDNLDVEGDKVMRLMHAFPNQPFQQSAFNSMLARHALSAEDNL